MKALEGRVMALERAGNRPLPLYALTFTDGTKANLDALDLHLYLARMKAGKEKPIATAQRIRGALPATGTAWEDLLNEISSINNLK